MCCRCRPCGGADGSRSRPDLGQWAAGPGATAKACGTGGITELEGYHPRLLQMQLRRRQLTLAYWGSTDQGPVVISSTVG